MADETEKNRQQGGQTGQHGGQPGQPANQPGQQKKGGQAEDQENDQNLDRQRRAS